MGQFPGKGTQTADLIHVCLGSGAASGPTRAGLCECADAFTPRQEVREDAGERKMRMRVPRVLLAQDQRTEGPGSDRDVTSSC